MVRIKRAYEPQGRSDGERILEDRLWPWGLSRRTAAIDEWMKDLGPSHELLKDDQEGRHRCGASSRLAIT